MTAPLRSLLPVVLLLGGAFPSLLGQERRDGGDEKLPQFSLSGGMGVGAHSAPSIVDYINAVAQPRPDQHVDDFTAAVEFFVMPELQVADDWSAALEYSFLLKSYSLEDRSGFSRSDHSYHVHMPTLLLRYVIPGEGYRFVLGGGAGYHLARFTQGFPAYGVEELFTASGLGIKLEAVGNTKFDESFYGSIGIDLRWEFLGPLKRGDGSTVIDLGTDTAPKMNFFNLGLKFGVLLRIN